MRPGDLKQAQPAHRKDHDAGLIGLKRRAGLLKQTRFVARSAHEVDHHRPAEGLQPQQTGGLSDGRQVGEHWPQTACSGRQVHIHGHQRAGGLHGQHKAIAQCVPGGQRLILRLIRRLARSRADDDLAFWQDVAKPRLHRRSRPDEPRLSLRRSDQPEDRRLVGPGFGGHLRLQQGPARRTARLQPHHAGLALAEVDKGQSQAPAHFVDADTVAGAEPGAAVRTGPLDQQPFWPSIQGHDAPFLARSPVQIEPPLVHGRR